MRKVKLAFVHDDFIQKGGAENLIWEIINYYSKDSRFEIKVFTSLVSEEWRGIFENSKIPLHCSFLQKIPFVTKFYKLLSITSLYYLAFSEFDFDSYDYVFSSSTRYAHYIITKPAVIHISYINSPPKMFWELEKYYFGRKNLLKIIKFFLPKLRIYDYYSRSYCDHTLVNSANISKKINQIYNETSEVLYPFLPNHNDNSLVPFPINFEKYYVIISRLTKWKRIDYVIEAFNKNQKNLVVIGSGEVFEFYRKIAKPNIQLVGYLASPQKNFLLSNCEALIFPQDEDFGLVILEALKFSKPVIYYDRGGAREILNTSVGVSFTEQNELSLNSSIIQHENKKYIVSDFENLSRKFQKEIFFKKLNFFFLSSRQTNDIYQ